MIKKKYHISGFDCPNCAHKAEAHLGKNEALEYCHIDFSTNKMYLTFKEKELTVKEIADIIAEVESDPLDIHESDGKFEKETKIFTKDMWFLLGRIIFAIVVLLVNLLVLSHFDDAGWIRFGLYTFATLVLVYDIVWRVLIHIRHLKNIIDHNLLITIAVSGATALAVIYLLEGDCHEGVHSAMEAMMVVGLFQIGQIIEKIATNRSKAAVMNAISLRVEYANLLKNGQIIKVDPEELHLGDNVVISAGEMIPVDGQVVDGSAYIDKSSLTGEFVPVLADAENGEVLAGCLVKTGSITIKATKKYEDSAVSKIIDLISNSGEKKSKADEFIAKFAKWYTPVIVLLAVLAILIGGLITHEWRNWIVRGLEILVTGCPCAIVISVPLAYFASIGLASKRGIVIKGANYLDELNNVRKIVTDKTGTLTYGVFKIQKVVTADGVEQDELLHSLYAAECLSTHPIAKAICHDVDVKTLAARQKDYKEIAGYGVQTTYHDEIIYAGSAKYMSDIGVDSIVDEENGNIVHCKKGDIYLVYIVLND